MFTLDNVDRINENILVKLLSSQTLFRCLKYNSSDALAITKADVTDNEKVLLANQDGDTTATRIFYTPFNLNIEDTERSEIRIFVRRFKPDNIYLSGVDIMIEVITSNRMVRLDGGRQRLLVMVSEIVKTLHGVDIGFVGNLYFDKPINIVQYGTHFTGYEMMPCTRSA